MSAIKFITTLSAALLLFTGCGDGFSSDQSTANGSTNEGTQEQAGTTPDIIDETPVNDEFTFSAGIKDSSGFFGSGRIINYNKDSKSLEVTIPFPLAALLPDSSGVLPKNPNISFTTSSSEKTITLSVPISQYVDLVENPTSLPNGRSLPGVNGGEAPSFGFPLGFLDLDAYGYAAFDSFSIFIESSFKLPINFAIPIKSEQDGSNLGKIRWLAPLSGQSGGVFISLRLPKELSVILANAL